MQFDVIVIGSGFGGAITGCRLAEQGYKVLILERGRRWNRHTYPRAPGDPWMWSHAHPEREHGWLDLRCFKHMTVAQGAGVGGGSLIYANVSCEAPAHVFENPSWPEEISLTELKPFYDHVRAFMNVQKLPRKQWNPRTKLMQEAATQIGDADRFFELELAITFDPTLSADDTTNLDASNSKTFVNAQGVQQGTCIHLGNCDIGCDVDAKNTLDKNYIPWAEKHHAEVRELHLVNSIEPVDGGYKVSFDRLAGCKRVPSSEEARIVIVAAGSLTSTELLLSCRDFKRTLPNLSPFLGRDWSSNGDFLTPALYSDRMISPTRGPTITSAIDYQDGTEQSRQFWIQDGGAPNLLRDWLLRAEKRPPQHLIAREIVESLRHLLRNANPLQGVMPWFAQGVDAANGQLTLKRSFWGLGAPKLELDWDVAKSSELINTIVAKHIQLSEATGGAPKVPPTWRFAHHLITPHPLGGCNMGRTSERGVVDHKSEVFGYRNLFVVDGSIIPEALGVNPSRTIGALAERAAHLIATEGR